MRNYVDKDFDERAKPRRKRKRLYDDSKFADDEDSAPVSAPRWALTGYQGSLKNAVDKKCDGHIDN